MTSREPSARARLEAEGPTIDVPTLAPYLGVSDWSIYEQIRRGTWTLTRVLRIGRTVRIPTSDVINLLYPPTPPPARASAGAAA